MPLLSLPNELLLLIADHLPLSSLSALHRTTHHLHTLTTPHLHRAALLPRPSSYGMDLPALHWAAWKGHTSLAHLLLTTFSHPVDAKTAEHGKTALHCAAWQGHLEMVRLLLDSGAEIDAADTKYGKTALHQAVVRGWSEIVELLLGRGADVGSRDHGGQTALLWATKCQSPESELLVGIFRMLLERDRVCGGGMLDAREDERGETALHWAVWRGQRATVRLFLEFGADVYVESCEGQTALEWAVRKGNEGILRMVVGRAEVAEMVAAEVEAEEKMERVKEKVEGLGNGEGGEGEGETREKGTRWGKRIKSIRKVVERIPLLKQLEKRHIKELGEV